MSRSSKQNPRVLFPATGFPTNDLAMFYGGIAPVLLPHLAHRPVTLKRFPDNIHAESFWEKDLPAFAPAWVKIFAIPRVNEPTDINYINIGDLKTLVWAAQIGCIEIHPFLHCYPEFSSTPALSLILILARLLTSSTVAASHLCLDARV